MFFSISHAVLNFEDNEMHAPVIKNLLSECCVFLSTAINFTMRFLRRPAVQVSGVDSNLLGTVMPETAPSMTHCTACNQCIVTHCYWVNIWALGMGW